MFQTSPLLCTISYVISPVQDTDTTNSVPASFEFLLIFINFISFTLVNSIIINLIWAGYFY